MYNIIKFILFTISCYIVLFFTFKIFGWHTASVLQATYNWCSGIFIFYLCIAANSRSGDGVGELPKYSNPPRPPKGSVEPPKRVQTRANVSSKNVIPYNRSNGDTAA